MLCCFGSNTTSSTFNNLQVIVISYEFVILFYLSTKISLDFVFIYWFKYYFGTRTF